MCLKRNKTQMIRVCDMTGIRAAWVWNCAKCYSSCKPAWTLAWGSDNKIAHHWHWPYLVCSFLSHTYTLPSCLLPYVSLTPQILLLSLNWTLTHINSRGEEQVVRQTLRSTWHALQLWELRPSFYSASPSSSSFGCVYLLQHVKLTCN